MSPEARGSTCSRRDGCAKAMWLEKRRGWGAGAATAGEQGSGGSGGSWRGRRQVAEARVPGCGCVGGAWGSTPSVIWPRTFPPSSLGSCPASEAQTPPTPDPTELHPGAMGSPAPHHPGSSHSPWFPPGHGGAGRPRQAWSTPPSHRPRQEQGAAPGDPDGLPARRCLPRGLTAHSGWRGAVRTTCLCPAALCLSPSEAGSPSPFPRSHPLLSSPLLPLLPSLQDSVGTEDPLPSQALTPKAAGVSSPRTVVCFYWVWHQMKVNWFKTP